MVRVLLFTGENILAPLKALDRINDELFADPRGMALAPSEQTTDRGGCPLALLSVSPRKRRSSGSDAEKESWSSHDSKFSVSYNVRGYKPGDITVKTVERCVVISGKYEEKGEDGGYLKRAFTRRFTLPEGVDPETVTCSLSASGVLAIEAPKAQSPCKKPRLIPIQVESTREVSANTPISVQVENGASLSEGTRS